MASAFQIVVLYACFVILGVIAAVCAFIGLKNVGDALRARLCPVSLLMFAIAAGIATSEAQKRGGGQGGASTLLPLPNAVTNAAWRAHGAYEAAFYIPATNWWARMQDGGWIDRLRIFSSGGFQAKGADGGAWTNYPPPFAQKLSLAPEAHWPLLTDTASLFWHGTTPSNTLVMTWWGGLYERSHTNLVNFQVELFNDGSFDYRYADHTEHFAVSLPFDLDGDGLENSVDPDPLTAGPDAHGTNAEWYNTACSNVFSSASWREGVNSNAYYFVDVVAERGPTPIYFTGDRDSRLGNPVVVALAGVTNRVPLLIGIDYAVTSDTPFSVSFPFDYMHPTVTTNGMADYNVRWPLNIVFTEGLGTSNRVYTVTVEPYDPGGVLEWDVNVPMRGGSGGDCDCVYCSGNLAYFTCSSTCTCSGGCRARGRYLFEVAEFPVEGGECRCGFDDPPPDTPPSSHDPTDEPSLTITFSESAVIFEDAYEDSPGVTKPRRSTRVRLTIDAYAGSQGGALWISDVNMDKLVALNGNMSLPYSQQLAAGESYHATCTYEGLVASESLGDVGVSGSFTETGTGHHFSASNRITVVRVEFTPDYLIDNYPHRHRVGVRESSKCSWLPTAATLICEACTGGRADLKNGRWHCAAPLTAGASPYLTTVCQSVRYPFILDVVEPQSVVAKTAEAFDYGVPENVAGGAGMELELVILPTNVSFTGIAVQEVPSDYKDPQGYFANPYFDFCWSHTTNMRAGAWHNVQANNLFMYDCAEMGDQLPRMTLTGEVTDSYAYGWISGSMNWMIPVGWNEIDSENTDVPVKQFCIYWQRFRMASDGTLEVEKLTNVVQRATNSVVRLNGATVPLRPR